MSWPGSSEFQKSMCKFVPILNGDVSVMIHFCAGKILVQENSASA